MTAALVTALLDTLRLGDAPPADLVSRWRAADTGGLTDLIDYEGGAVWLFRRLRAVDALAALPVAAVERMRALAFEASAVRLEVEAEASDAISLLDDAAIPVIAIKGVARCALAARYCWLDARITSDVDLLVPQPSLAGADAVLRAAGYRDAVAPDHAIAHHHHLPPLVRGTITVELHASTSVHLPADVAWRRASEHGETIPWNGRAVRVPHVTELAWAAIAHAIEDEAGGFRLKRFLEVAALAAGNAPVDWDEIERRLAGSREHAPDVPVDARRAHLRAWLDAAMWFVTPGRRPAPHAAPAFEIPALLAWRHRVLRPHRWMSARFRAHLLEEGARALIGMDTQPSPPEASPAAQLRRAAVNEASRAMFTAWRRVSART